MSTNDTQLQYAQAFVNKLSGKHTDQVLQVVKLEIELEAMTAHANALQAEVDRLNALIPKTETPE